MNVKVQKKICLDDVLKYDDYKNVLFSRSYMRNAMNKIQSNENLQN